MNTVYLEEVDSTNLYAKSNLENLADKSIVHAAKQTAGRGRLQRSWIDLGNENLFLSFVLKPSQTDYVDSSCFPRLQDFLAAKPAWAGKLGAVASQKIHS